MNNGLKPYDEYKEVELPWLLKLPKHWEIIRAKLMFDVIDKRSETGQEELLSVSSSNGVVKRSDTSVNMFKAESYIGYKLCWPGDLAVNSLWAWQKGLGFSRYHGIISTAYSVYRIKDSNNKNIKFYDYYVRDVGYAWELRIRSKGIWKSRYQLTDLSFLDSPMICPTKEEQDKIVRYLDSKLAKINKFIKNKRKLIELLKEQKQAIINQAVTKGLDPNAKMKPSGVEWLGDIPEGWEVVQLKRVTKAVKTGGTPQGAEDKYYEDDGFNWFTPSDFEDSLYLRKSTRQLSELGKESVTIFPPNTVMMIGIGGTMGKVSISEDECSCNQQINGIICNELIETKYLTYYLRAKRKDIFDTAKYTTLPILNQEESKKIPIILCSIEEQQNIIAFIETKIHSVDKAIERIKKEIDLITEYRTSLIYSVVTGKVDVRNIEVENVLEEIEEDVEDLVEETLEEE